MSAADPVPPSIGALVTRPISRREIHEGWTVRPLAGPVPPVVHAAGGIPAAVPGVVHTDLLAAGLIADPYLGTNEKAQEWIGSTDWEYRTSFVAAPGADRSDLVFHGL